MKSTANVYGFEFLTGDLKKKEIKIKPYDNKLIKVDDWYPAEIGELCMHNGKIGVVRNIRWSEPTNIFKGTYMYLTTIEDVWISRGMVHRVEVRKGKIFNHNGVDYTHIKNITGEELHSYIDITRNERVANMGLINKAYNEGKEAHKPKREYYENLKNKPVRPIIINPYNNMDIMNYARFEIIKNWDAGYKAADDSYIKEVFSRNN